MIKTPQFSIFKKGSRTYFYSSLFFPPDVRDDVFTLYAFVRCADDFVDSLPQQRQEFYTFKNMYLTALHGQKSENVIIDSFVDLVRAKHFNENWIESFLEAMEADLTKSVYGTMKETEMYMYGSAEVVGLMMAKILELPEESYVSARALGKAMQYCNFIRDISEDLSLTRQYIPQEELDCFGLKSLSFNEVEQHKEAFEQLIQRQIGYYKEWVRTAEQGFHFIPKRYLIPIKTATDMYSWTLDQIEKNPMIVYEKKVKPSVSQIVWSLSNNAYRL